MSEDKTRMMVGRQLVIILNKYTEVIQLQLLGLRKTMLAEVEDVMKVVQRLSQATDQKAKAADAILEQTYLNPDEATKEFVETVQHSIDSLFENYKMDEHFLVISKEQSVIDDKLRRFAGQFSKHMEAMSTMDSATSSILFRMISALSTDDLVAQRLQHLVHAIHALEISLSYILIDFSRRFTTEEIERVKNDLLAYTYRQYTMEQEKELFRKIFGPPPKSLS
jgi:hypothetical protein